MKYTIIIPSFNELDLLTACISSVFKHTKDFQLIVVNNGSSDNTANYLQFLFGSYPNVLAATLDKNMGFAHAINTALPKATGDYIILLNNDTIVTPGWSDNMVSCIPKAEKFFDVSPIALVGPVSNNAGGEQGIDCDQYLISQLDEASISHRKEYKDSFSLAGFLSGFCLLFKKEVYDSIGGLDTKFKVGGWEDNDFMLRAFKVGYKAVIDRSTFIHHYGQTTLKKLKDPYPPIYFSNQLHFYDKHFTDKKKKLITVCRARNASEYLPMYLYKASIYSDEIIVLLDRTTDSSSEICKKYVKVTEVINMDSTFDEYRDRGILLQKAQDHGADWILSLDADEILEDSFTYDYAHLLMQPLNPEILSYDFNFRNFFNGQTHFRCDGVFGNMHGARMWQVLPNQKIRSLGHSGLHCTHGPQFPPFYIRPVRARIKHYGYDTPKKCLDKYTWYTKIDPDPDKLSTGPEGYKHLISPSYSLVKWRENSSVTLCVVTKNEEINLFNLLSQYYSFFDDLVIVDTGSTDRTVKIAKTFGCNVYNYKWHNDFSKARNFAKSKCTTDWIFFLDPDEQIDVRDFPFLYRLLEDSPDAYLFQVFNYLKDGTIAYSDNVRLLRNIPEIYFSNYVHENISESVSESHLNVGISPVNIKHYGYLKSDKIALTKSHAYKKMLKRQIRDFPKNPIGYFHYAFHYFKAKRDDQAIQYLKKCLDLQPTFFLAHKELALHHLKLSHKHFSELKDIIPSNHYFHSWAQEVFNRVNSAITHFPNTP